MHQRRKFFVLRAYRYVSLNGGEIAIWLCETSISVVCTCAVCKKQLLIINVSLSYSRHLCLSRSSGREPVQIL